LVCNVFTALMHAGILTNPIALCISKRLNVYFNILKYFPQLSTDTLCVRGLDPNLRSVSVRSGEVGEYWSLWNSERCRDKTEGRRGSPLILQY